MSFLFGFGPAFLCELLVGVYLGVIYVRGGLEP